MLAASQDVKLFKFCAHKTQHFQQIKLMVDLYVISFVLNLLVALQNFGNIQRLFNIFLRQLILSENLNCCAIRSLRFSCIYSQDVDDFSARKVAAAECNCEPDAAFKNWGLAKLFECMITTAPKINRFLNVIATREDIAPLDGWSSNGNR